MIRRPYHRMRSPAPRFEADSFIKLALGLVLASSGCAREDPVDWIHPDLRYLPRPVPEAENAYPVWAAVDAEALFNEMVARFPDAGFAPGGETPHELRRWLESKRETFRTIREGIRRGKCQVPSSPAGEGDLGKFSRFVRVASALKRLRVRSFLTTGDHNSARAELQCLMDFHEVLEASELPLFVVVTSALARSETLKLVRRFAADRELPVGLLETIRLFRSHPDAMSWAWRRGFFDEVLPRILQIPENGSPAELAAALTGDLDAWPGRGHLPSFRKGVARVRETIAAVLEGHPSPFERRATVERASDFAMETLKNFRTPWDQRDEAVRRAIRKEAAAWPNVGTSQIMALLFSEMPRSGVTHDLDAIDDEEVARARKGLRTVRNPVGKFILREWAAVDPVKTAVRNRADLEGTRAFLALRIYEHRNRELPGSLEALVDAGLLATLPSDPIDGSTLKYSRARRLLWTAAMDDENRTRSREGTDEPDAGFLWRLPIDD